MINNFNSLLAKHIFNGIIDNTSRKLSLDLHFDAQHILDVINAATNITTLHALSNASFEKMYGEYHGCWAMRINKKWCVIFRWKDAGASDVDVIKYAKENVCYL